MQVTTSKHKRSKNFSYTQEFKDNVNHSVDNSNKLNLDKGDRNDCRGSKNNKCFEEVKSSLRQEIMELERGLEDQVTLGCSLEKALGCKSFSQNATQVSMPKPTTELVEEIAELKLEVVRLEQHLLSLCRKKFEHPSSSLSSPPRDDKLKSPMYAKPDRQSVSDTWRETARTTEDRVRESWIHRSHSSLTQHLDRSKRASTSEEMPGKALHACQSQPVSMIEYAQNSSSNLISLAEHLGTRISDHVPETPNKLSEDMVRCMCTIYRKVANPFHVEGLKEFNGPYSTMVEVQCIYKDSHKLANCRSIVSRLEEIDPGKLSHAEKLAFWINTHNRLVMHAFLSYGIPQKNVKRVYLLSKATYNVGGHVVSADVIQSSILGCRMSRPGQWFRFLLSFRGKFITSDERQGYAIEHPEPLLHFALCSGNYSDPAVRVCTPKRVFQELEAAKQEYIRATFGVKKDQKVVLPKVEESFAKDSGLSPSGIMEMIQQSLPAECLRRSVKKIRQGNSHKNIEWVPHNAAFRYLILKELVK